MTSMFSDRRADFSLADLHSAIDTQRRRQGITWEQAIREINLDVDSGSGRHPIARSTVAGLCTKAVAEGDGVLQMLRWLNRAPESFVPGCEALDIHRLPDAPSDRVLRFDTAKMHAALDAQRKTRGMTWRQAADEIGGTTAASLTNLRKGGRIGFPGVMRLARWLGQPTAHFVRITDR